MKIFKYLFWFLVLSLNLSYAQTINVTATITDSDGQTWNNGSWSVQLASVNGPPFYNGTVVSTNSQSGYLSPSGSLAVTLYNTSTITPIGAMYNWTICSFTSAPCSIFQTPVTSSNLSTLLSSMVTAPRFSAGIGRYGYLDIETLPIPVIGSGYYNVTNSVGRVWNGSTFVNSSGSGTTLPPNASLIGSDSIGNAVSRTSVSTTMLSGVVAPANLPIATAIANGTVQLPSGQTSAQLALSAITGRYGDLIAAQNFSLYNVTRQTRPIIYNYTGTGFSYGTGPVQPQFNYNSWSGDQFMSGNVAFHRRGITQYESAYINKYAIGDMAAISFYIYGIGGATAGSDQGDNPIAIYNGELNTYFQGTATANTVGATAILIAPASFNSHSNNHFCDGCYLTKKTAITTGHYTAIPTPVTQSGATFPSYFTQSTDATFTASTAYGRLVTCVGNSSAIPQTTGPQIYQTDTCTFTIDGGTNSSGFSASTNNGIATVAGQFPEQVQILSVGTVSAGQQSVTFSHKETNAVLYTTLWQGGLQGTLQTADYQENMNGSSGLPLGSLVFGSTDSHTMAGGVLSAGVMSPPAYMYHTATFYGGGRNSGNLVTVYRGSQFDGFFSGGISAVVSNCTDATMNGTVTNITESQNILTWNSANSGATTCGAVGTLTLAPAVQAFHVYPYAEQIAGDPALYAYNQDGTLDQTTTNNNFAATRIMTLEKNNLSLNTNDIVMEPHNPIMTGSSLLIANTQFGTHPSHQMDSIQIVTNGSGQNAPLIKIQDDASTIRGKYIGDGGVVAAPIIQESPILNGGFWHIQAPLGDMSLPVTLLDCPATDINCLNTIIIEKTNNVLWFQYIPQSQTVVFPRIQATTSITTPQIIGYSYQSPTCTVGTAAGTGATCSIGSGSTNVSGTITLTTGTSTTASGTLVTINYYGAPLTTAPLGCSLTPRNAPAATLATDVFTTTPTTSLFTIADGTAAPSTSATNIWYYGPCI